MATTHPGMAAKQNPKLRKWIARKAHRQVRDIARDLVFEMSQGTLDDVTRKNFERKRGPR